MIAPQNYLNQLTQVVLLALLALFLHEGGHILAAWSLGVKVKRVGISHKGMYIVRECGSPSHNLSIALAGPLLNLLLAGCFRRTAPIFAVLNLGMGLSNLIPAAGSDGQHAWKLLHHKQIEAHVRQLQPGTPFRFHPGHRDQSHTAINSSRH